MGRQDIDIKCAHLPCGKIKALTVLTLTIINEFFFRTKRAKFDEKKYKSEATLRTGQKHLPIVCRRKAARERYKKGGGCNTSERINNREGWNKMIKSEGASRRMSIKISIERDLKEQSQCCHAP